MMDDRLGPLIQEFKDLVYPADYNPEGKPSAKRKPGEVFWILKTKEVNPIQPFSVTTTDAEDMLLFLTAEAGGVVDKKPKVAISEDELRAHVAKGTLGKLTVPVLKDACKQFGVRTTGTKKQELIDALIAQLS